MRVNLCFTCEPFERRQGGCASSLAHLLSKNYTRGDEDAALAWQAEGAGPLQLVPPVSDAWGQSALKSMAVTSAWFITRACCIEHSSLNHDSDVDTLY